MSGHTLLVFLLFSLLAPFAAAEPTPGTATALLAELGIRESATPLRERPGWQRPKRIVLAAPGTGAGLDAAILAGLEKAADGIELVVVSDPDRERDALSDADVLLGSCRMIRKDMGRLRWVQHLSAGVESCDLALFAAQGVLLSNMKGVFGPGIAEHVMAMMLSLSRGLHRYHREQEAGNWNRALASQHPMLELRGKTLLVVGLGGIGSEIAWRAHALGMRVNATRNSRQDKPAYVEYVGLADELPVLAATADVIVNATPLTDATRGLFDRVFFARLKDSAYFINIGRGASVVTDDLLAALESGRLAGAALDVVDPEPLPADHPLWQQPNVIITPHVSGRSDRVGERLWVFVTENLRRYVSGDRLLNRVDVEKGY